VLSGLVALTSDLFTLELMSNVSHGTDKIPANFGVSETFSCQIMGKHAPD